MSVVDALNNKYRVLLTEVLPYELPIMLDNEAFYQNMLDDETRKVFEKTFEGVLRPQHWSIPFDYSIRRMGGEKSRRLSLIHPLTQHFGQILSLPLSISMENGIMLAQII